MIKKIENKFDIINLNERVEKYLLNRFSLNSLEDIYNILKPKMIIVTRGKKGADFIINNKKITKEVVDYAHSKGVSVEAEVGHVGGTEDNVYGDIFRATLEDCIEISKTGIDALAPALGSVHGLYKGEPNLDFERMQEINETLSIPLVLHGGTGIPYDMIKKAISCGISKININTELQVTWHKAVVNFINENPSVYDPRKVIGSGEAAMKDKVSELVDVFNPNHISSKN